MREHKQAARVTVDRDAVFENLNGFPVKTVVFEFFSVAVQQVGQLGKILIVLGENREIRSAVGKL